MTEKDRLMEGWERLPPSFLTEAQEGLERAEDRLLGADEGYAEWLAGMDVEGRRAELEGEGFADREVGM